MNDWSLLFYFCGYLLGYVLHSPQFHAWICRNHSLIIPNWKGGGESVSSWTHQCLFPRDCILRTKIVCSKYTIWASLVAQWLRIHLPMQGTRVQSLVQEDPRCRGATKPVCCNYWACALELASHNYWACAPQLLKPTRLEPVLRNKRSHRNEEYVHRNKE